VSKVSVFTYISTEGKELIIRFGVDENKNSVVGILLKGYTMTNIPISVIKKGGNFIIKDFVTGLALVVIYLSTSGFRARVL
jgi:hypothetical protein